MRGAVVLAVLLFACEDGAATPRPEATGEAMAACETHGECRVVAGVCDTPTPVNAAHIETMERVIEVRGRHRTCNDPGVPVADTTPACVTGTCVALLGPAAEHACESDADCVVTRGLCGPTEAVAAEAEDAFRARVEALEERHVRCGYGRVDVTVRAVCDDGLCVPASVGR